ncbi:MAG: nucleoside phosphorylase [Candidatus Acetothermia bacterium]
MLPHLKLEPGDLPEYVLFPGDPDRAKRVGDRLEDSKDVASNREYRSIVGNYGGVPVGVVSAGIGAPGAAIAYEEAIKAGAETLIRIGTTGSLNRDKVDSGDLVVVESAVRDEGLSGQHVPLEVPAAPDRTVTNALADAAEDLNYPYTPGMVLTTDAFYVGNGALDRKELTEVGVLAVEMECAALFTVALVRGVRAGAVLAVNGDASKDKSVINEAIGREIDVALDAVVGLESREPHTKERDL